MDCIYGKLNYEKIIKEYSVESNDEYNTIDLKIDNNKNTISAKVNRTPGKLTITKNITPTERETILEFDGSQNKEINLAEIDMYTGLETDTSIVTIDTENNTIKSDVKKTPGTLSFQKADLLLEETFDGSKDVTVKIPETIFHGISRDNTINFETEDFSNIIYAEVNKVPNKLNIIEDLEQLNYDGSNEVSVDLTKYAFKDDIPSLQDLPQFTNKLEIDLSYAPSLNGFITFPIVSSSNFYVNWGDGTGTYYQEATTSMSHQYSDTEFAGWITIYGDWKGLNFVNNTTRNSRILISIIYDDNIVSIPSYGLQGNGNQLINLKTLKLSDNVTSIGTYGIGCPYVNEFKFPSHLQTLGNYATNYFYNITYLEIPPGIERIGSYSINLYGQNNSKVKIVFNRNLNPNVTFTGNNCIFATWGDMEVIFNAEASAYTFSTSSPINVLTGSKTLTIYVPKSQLQQFKQKTNLTTYADKIYPIGGNYTESITIPSTSWDAETKTVTVTAIGATSEDRNVVMPSIPSEYDDYGIRCIAQGTMTLTFTCDEIPTEDVTIGVAYMLTNQ